MANNQKYIRPDLFPTLPREETRVIAIRDIKLDSDKVPDVDAVFHLDREDCQYGRFGLGVHFVVLRSGVIVEGRGVETRGSFGRRYSDIAVAIGVIGGERENRLPDQVEALEELIAALQENYPEAVVQDGPSDLLDTHD